MMKKLILCAALAAAAGGLGTAAWADGADCQAGNAYGAKPGCSGPDYGPTTREGIMGNSGMIMPPQRDEAYYGRSAPDYPYFRSEADRQAWERQRWERAHRRDVTRHDRDGDGVRNRDDRYPDNPYRR
jgi:hypothetical protein